MESLLTKTDSEYSSAKNGAIKISIQNSMIFTIYIKIVALNAFK